MKKNEKQKKENHIHDENDLIHEIEELTHTIEKQNSYSHGFWSGVVKGIGYAIGATILFGILLTIIGYIVQTSDAEWVQSLAKWARVGDYITD